MKEIRVREGRVPLVVGMLDCGVFVPALVLSVWDGVQAGDRVQVLFCTGAFGGFLLLGVFLLLSSFRRELWLGTEGIRYRPALGRKREYGWREVVRAEASLRQQYRLIGPDDRVLARFEGNMPGSAEALEYLSRRGVPLRQAEARSDEESWIRTHWSRERIDRERRLLRPLGRVLALVTVAAWLLLPARWMLGVCMGVVWSCWGLYLALYPRLRLDGGRLGRNLPDCCDELPWVGPALALFFLLTGTGSVNLDGADFLRFTAAGGVLLFLTYLGMLILRRRRERPLKMLSVALAVLLISFSGTAALNVLATVEPARHQEARVIGLHDERSGRGLRRYYLELESPDGPVELEVSRDLYQGVVPGSSVQICARRSIFGVRYRTVHE